MSVETEHDKKKVLTKSAVKEMFFLSDKDLQAIPCTQI